MFRANSPQEIISSIKRKSKGVLALLFFEEQEAEKTNAFLDFFWVSGSKKRKAILSNADVIALGLRIESASSKTELIFSRFLVSLLVWSLALRISS